jgi:hypothetical protein
LALGGGCETNVDRFGDGKGEGSRKEDGCEKEEFGEGRHF